MEPTPSAGEDGAALDAHFQELRRLEVAAEAHALAQLVAAVGAGDEPWSVLGWAPDAAFAGRSGENWLELLNVDDTALRVCVRVATTPEGIGVTGLLVERDGQEVTVTDLRKLHLKPLTKRLLAGYRPLLARQAGPQLSAKRPGRKGHSIDHWQDVAQRYDEVASHRDFIKQMCESYPNPKDRPSDATVRRWVKTIRAMRAKGEL